MYSNSKLSNHLRRYALIWDLYSNIPDMPYDDEIRIGLEREMDNIQDEFNYLEFQEFKKTLPRFMDYWS